jgi:two-component sensor histidine kinase
MAPAREVEAALLQQQTALAKFGEFALTSDDFEAILHEACRRVREGLKADFAKVMELQPDGRTLLARAGVGWKPGIIGNATSISDETTFEGQALATRDPVICTKLRPEDAGKVAPFLLDHGVSAFVNVNILRAHGEASYGILEVDCLEPRDFTAEDTDFLRTYASLLAVVVARRKADVALRLRAEENERLLKELQHRTKNNLQILTGLIHFEARRSADPAARDALTKVGHRVNALSLVHEKLYLSAQVDRIELRAHLRDIALSLLRLQADGGSVRLVDDSESVECSPDLAVTLGLVINEFVTNSLKYAFEAEGGTVGIELKRQPDDTLRLVLWDDGKGIPLDESGDGSGMKLIERLVRPVAREMTWSNGSGARLTLIVEHSNP